MKISGFGGIALSGMLLLPTFGAVAGDPYSMYKAYKTYQDPVARAAAIERMRTAKAIAQERLQAGMTYAGERAQASMAYAQEKGAAGWQQGKELAKRHKGRLIAGGIALLAALTLAGLGYDKHQRGVINERTTQEYLDAQKRNKTKWKLNEKTSERIQSYGNMIQGLRSISALKKQVVTNMSKGDPDLERAWNAIFDKDLEGIPGLQGALIGLQKK